MSIWRKIILFVLVRCRLIAEPDLVISMVSDHPPVNTMKPKTLYLVADQGFQKWAYFLCPAKPDEVIQLSLQAKRRPHWAVMSDLIGRPTITPSVRQLEGSYAHFWVKAGVIHWCEDTGKKPVRFHH